MSARPILASYHLPVSRKQGRIHVSEKADRTYNGITFDSKAEMHRYFGLLAMEKNGTITELELQPEFILQESYVRDGKKIQALTYRADFAYRDFQGRKIIEDVKGMKTEVYKIKKKILLYKYPDINFIETK